MKVCRCTDQNCGCYLSDNMTVGNINHMQYTQYQQMIPNTFWIENKPINMKQHYLNQCSLDELIAEIKTRKDISVHNISVDDNVEVISIVVKK